MKSKVILFAALGLICVVDTQAHGGWGGGGAFAGGLVTGAVLTSAASQPRQTVVIREDQPRMRYCDEYPGAPECRRKAHRYCDRHPNAPECQ